MAEPGRYTQKQLHEEAKRLAKERGGRLLFWEIVLVEHPSLVVHYETKGKFVAGGAEPAPVKCATNMAL